MPVKLGLKELPHRAYIWKKDFPQVITIDEITSKEIFIEIHALRYPLTKNEGLFFTVLFAFCPWINERGWNNVSTKTLNKLLTYIQRNK